MSISEKPPVVFLLAVWGESFIENFFQYSLPSLLAPGNLPAISQEYDCSFVFLTRNSDTPFFKTHPYFMQLMTYCHIDFIEISDLIFNGNYSATLTLAYERGVRSRGEKMCQTYFFFLVSDYIMANGSLRNLIPYLRAGYSGITTGNFLVVEEYIAPVLKNLMEADEKGNLILNAREMLALAFPFLHPVSIAHSVTQSLTHATHANRLFWKVNDKVMIGRFYLRHMLCIKPEIDNYIIGSFSDYSFIPEMCPSGNVAHIQDSDEYCVIEMAPFEYESRWIRSGKHTIQRLANQLSMWTTQVHRANAYIPILFHSEELNEPPFEMLQASADYINAIEVQLSQPPQPVRGHYYWNTCIDSIMLSILKQSNRSKYYHQGMFAGIIGSPTFSPVWDAAPTDDRSLLKVIWPSPTLLVSKKQRRKNYLKAIMIGVTPKTAPWHLSWLEDSQLKADFKKKLNKNASYVVIAFEPVPHIINWLEKDYPGCCTYQYCDFLMRRTPEELRTIFHNRQHVLIWIGEEHFNELGKLLRLCAKYLSPGNAISVYLKPKRIFYKKNFQKSTAICNADLLNAQVICEQMKMHYSLPKAYLQRLSLSFAKKLFAPQKSLGNRVIGLMGLSTINAASVVGNLLSLLGITSKKKGTSATLLFKCNASPNNPSSLHENE